MNLISTGVKEIADLTGVTRQAVLKRAAKESWPYHIDTTLGGSRRMYPLHTLPGDIQAAYISFIYDTPGRETDIARITGLLPALAPEAAAAIRDNSLPIPTFAGIAQGAHRSDHWNHETAISENDLRDPRVKKILAILREAEQTPPGWKKRKWIESLAIKHDVTFQSIYRWMKKYEKKGIAGICHRKSTRNTPKKWTPEAIDYWLGLCLKRTHRKIDKKDLYDILIIEAHRRGWKIGGYESALWWYDKKATPQLIALQRGGMRALDNTLPPILRDYSDLAPFEMLVGDQHRFDFWVTDDETGEVFRPEGYVWQDLRTRIIYGAAIDRRYDSQLIGLALRIGISVYGAFGSIYTDNGRPEISRYITGIMADMRTLGMGWQRTIDAPVDTLDMDTEDINPAVIAPGTHKKAIVKNAKAKMIEGTFDKLERIMRSVFRLAGSVKRLGDDIHAQDIDHNEAMRLAEQGKLPTFSEFALTMYRALDHYNRDKNHRGVMREWTWKPKPKQAVPYDCLRMCYERDDWRPRMITPSAADLIFLSKASRKVHLGRIQFDGDFYEHDAITELHGKRVDLRYNPMDPREIYIFRGAEYLCTATPVEYSSMKDMTLAQRKIIEKRTRRARIAEEYRNITGAIPDYRQYSEIDPLEKAAALIDSDRKKKAQENAEMYRLRTPEELEAEVAALEKLNASPKLLSKPLPERPSFFLDEFQRYEWSIKYQIAGGALGGDDAAWMANYEAGMTANQRDYWQTVKEVGM